MNAVPVWESPYTYSTQGFPILLVSVHPHSIFQDTHHGSKFAFYKSRVLTRKPLLLGLKPRIFDALHSRR